MVDDVPLLVSIIMTGVSVSTLSVVRVMVRICLRFLFLSLFLVRNGDWGCFALHVVAACSSLGSDPSTMAFHVSDVSLGFHLPNPSPEGPCSPAALLPLLLLSQVLG